MRMLGIKHSHRSLGTFKLSVVVVCNDRPRTVCLVVWLGWLQVACLLLTRSCGDCLAPGLPNGSCCPQERHDYLRFLRRCLVLSNHVLEDGSGGGRGGIRNLELKQGWRNWGGGSMPRFVLFFFAIIFFISRSNGAV